MVWTTAPYQDRKMQQELSMPVNKDLEGQLQDVRKAVTMMQVGTPAFINLSFDPWIIGYYLFLKRETNNYDFQLFSQITLHTNFEDTKVD